MEIITHVNLYTCPWANVLAYQDYSDFLPRWHNNTNEWQKYEHSMESVILFPCWVLHKPEPRTFAMLTAAGNATEFIFFSFFLFCCCRLLSALVFCCVPGRSIFFALRSFVQPQREGGWEGEGGALRITGSSGLLGCSFWLALALPLMLIGRSELTKLVARPHKESNICCLIRPDKNTLLWHLYRRLSRTTVKQTTIRCGSMCKLQTTFISSIKLLANSSHSLCVCNTRMQSFCWHDITKLADIRTRRHIPPARST